MKKHSFGYNIAVIAIYLACITTLIITVLICIGSFYKISKGDLTNHFAEYGLNNIWTLFNI